MGVCSHRSVSPALFDASYSPELVAVLCQFFSDPLQMWRKNNLRVKYEKLNTWQSQSFTK